MKVVLSILGGLCFSVITFVAGLVAATLYFSSGDEKKQLADTTDLWTNHPVRIDAASNNFERLPSRAATPEPALAASQDQSRPPTTAGTAMAAARDTADGMEDVAIDTTMTGSISPDQMDTSTGTSEEPKLSEAHLEWCSSRYRSYRPRDNSYTPYSGGRRECKSPFSTTPQDQAALSEEDTISPPPTAEDSFAEDAAEPANQNVEQAAADEMPSSYGSWEHAKSCFARYRSYRPEDNTYQPYGGGPRRQCR